MEFKEIIMPIEMTINGVEAEYNIWFDINYSPAWIAPNSGTSMAMSPDEPEEYEVYNVRIECIDGSFRELTTDENEYVSSILNDRAAEIIEEFKGMEKVNDK